MAGLTRWSISAGVGAITLCGLMFGVHAETHGMYAAADDVAKSSVLVGDALRDVTVEMTTFDTGAAHAYIASLVEAGATQFAFENCDKAPASACTTRVVLPDELRLHNITVPDLQRGTSTASGHYSAVSPATADVVRAAHNATIQVGEDGSAEEVSVYQDGAGFVANVPVSTPNAPLSNGLSQFLYSIPVPAQWALVFGFGAVLAILLGLATRRMDSAGAEVISPEIDPDNPLDVFDALV